ncbi:hypothetical protein ACOSQ2_017036 [Xanthoceras sorbifolium]
MGLFFLLGCPLSIKMKILDNLKWALVRRKTRNPTNWVWSASVGLLSGSCNSLCALGDVTTGAKGRQATQKSIIQFQSPKKGHRFSIGSAGHDEAKE